MDQQQINFTCLKCSSNQCKEGQLHAAGSFLAKIFDVQGTKFKTLTCEQCGYTELYKGGKKGTLGNVADAILG